MKFRDLRPGRVRDWFEAVRGGELWVFQHIPKTAGSSLAAELARSRAPYRNIHVNYADAAADLEEQRARMVASFLAEARERPFRSCSGHLRAGHVDAILAEHPSARLFTFVRDPVERVVSEYWYCRSPEHNDPEGFARAFPRLEDFAGSHAASNKMTAYITGRRATKPETAVAAAFERFEFIGSQKLYTLSFRVLSALLWYETQPQEKVRVSGRSNKKTELPEETAKLIRSGNRADLAIFRAVQETWHACRDEIVAELRRRAAERRLAEPRRSGEARPGA